MNRLLAGPLVVVWALSVAAAQDEAKEESATPAEQYKTLLKVYQEASGGGAVSDEERTKLIGRVYKLRYALALKFLELAESNPQDSIAVDALIQAVWQVNNIPWPVELVGRDSAASRALALLQRDHVRSEKLGPVCQRISVGFCREYEPFLRAVLAMNPHRPVRASACLGLAHFLDNRLQRIDLVREQPELAREFAGLFGQEYLDELKRQDRTQATREAETLFEQAVEKYGDVNLPDVGWVREKAQAALFELRHLLVGKEAPDIEGQDQDGQRFKLSDYRGKVVLLDFWTQY